MTNKQNINNLRFIYRNTAGDIAAAAIITATEIQERIDV